MNVPAWFWQALLIILATVCIVVVIQALGDAGAFS